VNHAANRTAVVYDAYPLWLGGVADALRRAGVEVVASTTETSAALAHITEHRPDLFVTDLPEDAAASTAFLHNVRDVSPSTKVIVLSARDGRERVDAALHAGAVAFVVKTTRADDFASAVRQSFDTSMFFPTPSASAPVATDGLAAIAAAALTVREVEILRLVGEGRSNTQVAKQLWVSEQTVKFHLSNVYRKLNVANRTEASRWAQITGMLPTTDEA